MQCQSYLPHNSNYKELEKNKHLENDDFGVINVLAYGNAAQIDYKSML